MTSYFRCGWSDLNDIRQHDAKYHANCGTVTEIETGSRIRIWRTFDFSNTKVVLSQPLRYVDDIWFADRL